MKWTTKIVKN